MGPQVRFCERPEGATPRAYSTGSGPRRREFAWRPVTERTVRLMVVPLVLPGSCQTPCRLDVVEVFKRPKLVAEAAVEALGVAVLPRAPRFNVEHFKLQTFKPVADRLRCELRAVVAANVIRDASGFEQLPKFIDHIFASDVSTRVKAQALAGVFVDDDKPLQCRSAGCAIEHEIPRLDIIPMIGATMIAAVFMLALMLRFSGGTPDALWSDDDDDVLDALYRTDRIADQWQPVFVNCRQRRQRPGIYGLVSDFVINGAGFNALKVIAGDRVASLPIELSRDTVANAIHALVHLPLSPDADFRANGISKNITQIRRYDFENSVLKDVPPVSRVAQPPESAARRIGSCCTPYLVTEDFVDACDTALLGGVSFDEVFADSQL